MALDGSTTETISAANYETILTHDLNSFDANQLGYATTVYVGGTYYVYYAALAYSNAKELGLATSTNGTDFLRYSNDPIVAPSEEPWFASFRILPSTVLYEDGTFKMWFFGIDSNSLADSGQTTGWGYGTSLDGINWTFNPDPIRSETGVFVGSQLIEVVHVGDTYYAYWRDLNGNNYNQDNRYFVSTSTDGVNFSHDTEFDLPGGAEMFAATDHGGKVISVWFDEPTGKYFTAYSENGIDFIPIADLEMPAYTVVEDLTVEGDTVVVWGSVYTGPGAWGGGTSDLIRFDVPLTSFISDTTQLDDPIVAVGDSGDNEMIGGNNADSFSGLAGKDTIDGAAGNDWISGGDAVDSLIGGAGNDQILGGNGADVLIGGQGNDTLSGGNGPDRFVFNAAESNGDVDVITDYKAIDTIALAGYGLSDRSDLVFAQQGGSVVVTAEGASGSTLQILLAGLSLASVSTWSFVFE